MFFMLSSRRSLRTKRKTQPEKRARQNRKMQKSSTVSGITRERGGGGRDLRGLVLKLVFIYSDVFRRLFFKTRVFCRRTVSQIVIDQKDIGKIYNLYVGRHFGAERLYSISVDQNRYGLREISLSRTKQNTIPYTDDSTTNRLKKSECRYRSGRSRLRVKFLNSYSQNECEIHFGSRVRGRKYYIYTYLRANKLCALTLTRRMTKRK